MSLLYIWCHIQSIIERFEHDASKKADEDVAERQFLLTENTIKLIYHLDDTRITASTREFETPPIGSDQAYNLTFSPDITSAYQVCMHTRIQITHVGHVLCKQYVLPPPPILTFVFLLVSPTGLARSEQDKHQMEDKQLLYNYVHNLS